MRIAILSFLGLLSLLVCSCQAQENKQNQQAQISPPVKFSGLSIKELIAIIDQAGSMGIIGGSAGEGENVEEQLLPNRFIDFTTYKPIKELADESNGKFIEKTVLRKNKLFEDNFEIVNFLNDKKVRLALYIKDNEIFKFIQTGTVQMEVNERGKEERFDFFNFGYVICSKSDSICLCIDYLSGGSPNAKFPATNIQAIKKLNFINLNTESVLYFNSGKLVKSFDYVYQDSTSNYPYLLKYFKEKYLKDGFLLQDDTKVADILALFKTKYYTGKLMIEEDYFSNETWMKNKYLKTWGPETGTHPRYLESLIFMPGK